MRGHHLRVQLGVPDRQPVGDDRAAARHRLQARHASGRVHEYVGGAQQIRHLVGEAQHPHPLAGREATAEALLLGVVAPGEADDGRVLDRVQLGDGALEVADAPAASRDDHDAAVRGQPERGAGSAALAWRQELRGDQRRDDLGAAVARDPLDVANGLLVHHEVSVDAALSPEEQTGHVRDRRDGRGCRAAGGAAGGSGRR